MPEREDRAVAGIQNVGVMLNAKRAPSDRRTQDANDDVPGPSDQTCFETLARRE